MLSGSLVAIVTPMLADGALDLPRLASLIDWHVAEGTDGIVIVGTTGESPTVDVAEHCNLIESAVRFAAGRVPVIAGTGGNSTREAIELTKFAKKAGANYALSVVPYYNKPTQEGLANATVLSLSQVPNIVGIKEATSSVERVTDLMRHVRKGFLVFSGDDATALSYMLLGAHGVISVTANVAPRLMHEMCSLARAGKAADAIAVNNRLLGLHRNLFLESNPIPVKWALNRMGRIAEGIRLPLTRFTAPHHETLAASLREAGCIE